MPPKKKGTKPAAKKGAVPDDNDDWEALLDSTKQNESSNEVEPVVLQTETEQIAVAQPATDAAAAFLAAQGLTAAGEDDKKDKKKKKKKKGGPEDKKEEAPKVRTSIGYESRMVQAVAYHANNLVMKRLGINAGKTGS